MAIDPVCGMYVEESPDTLHATVRGTTYYFCSESCLNEFTRPEGRASEHQAKHRPQPIIGHPDPHPLVCPDITTFPSRLASPRASNPGPVYRRCKVLPRDLGRDKDALLKYGRVNRNRNFRGILLQSSLRPVSKTVPERRTLLR